MYDYSAGADAIATAVANREVVFFIGAGLSATAGAPTWAGLVEAIRAELDPPTRENDPILLAQYYRNQCGDHQLYTLLRKRLNQATIRVSRCHELLCSLPIRVLVTTNYDRLIETTLEQLGRRVHVICEDHELGLWDEFQEVQLLKVHGDLHSAGGIVLTDEDYVRFLNDHKSIQRKLLEIFSYRTVVFIGYSMKDRTINHVYDKLLYELGRLKRPTYMTTFETDVHLIRHWEKRGIHPVHLSASEAAVLRTDAGSGLFEEDGGTTKTAATERFLSLLCASVRSRMQQRCDVLIVDDDLDQTELYAAHIRRRFPDFRVETAVGGTEGMLAIGKLKPRVVLLDMVMPGVDGYQLIQQIRRYPDLRDVALVCVSGRSAPNVRLRVLELGADDFVTKPVDSVVLTQTLQKHIHGRGVRDQRPVTRLTA